MNTVLKDALITAGVTADAPATPIAAAVRKTQQSPLDVFCSVFSLLDIRTKAFAARGLVSTFNASIIGQASRIVNDERRAARVPAQRGYAEADTEEEEVSTIDKFNALIAHEELQNSMQDDPELAAPVGLAPPSDPRELIQALAFFRDTIREELNFGDEMWDSMNDLKGTLDYMSSERAPIEERVQAAAAILDMSPEIIREKMKVNAAEEAARMVNNRGRIAEIIDETCDERGFYDWNVLPMSMRVKLLERIDALIAKQLAFAINGIFRGQRNAATDAKILQGAQEKLNACVNANMMDDPDFAEALVA